MKTHTPALSALHITATPTMPPHDIQAATPRVNGTPRPKHVRGNKNTIIQTQMLRTAHQRVNIDVDLSKHKILGFTEITVVPTSNMLRAVKLDCREMTINDVQVNGRRVNYIYQDWLHINDGTYFEESIEAKTVNIFDLYAKDMSIHQHHLLRQKLNYIFGEVNYDLREHERLPNANTEELIVILPDHFRFEVADATPGDLLTPHLKSKGTHSESYNPIQVLVEYELVNPKNGVNFITPKDGDKRGWHAYTANADFNASTSSWVPCVDNFWERSTWQIEVNIPRTIRDIGRPRIIEKKETRAKRRRRGRLEVVEEPEPVVEPSAEPIENDDEEDDENFDLTVCTGDYNNVKETPHSLDLSKKVVSWSIFNPICAHHVGWAVGCFESTVIQAPAERVEDDEFDVDDDIAKDNTVSPVTLYCLAGQLALAENTTVFASRAMEFLSKEYGSFPFSAYAIVFVHGSATKTSNFAGLSVIDDRLLYPPDIVEPMFEVTEDILECIATQWSGINIVPQLFNDLWCTIGIAKFMAFQFVKELMGNNEYRFRIKKRMEKIADEDVGKKPLGLQFFRFPVSDHDLAFIRLKAPIILFILDRRMTKTDKSFGMSRVLPKLFLQAMSGELQNSTMCTSHLQHLCEKVNRNRLDSFFNQWVYSAGVPIFNITQTFNKKKSMIEMIFRQVQHHETERRHPKSDTFVDESIAYLDDEPPFPAPPVFLGPMTIRVHEADGTPYEHVVDIKDGVMKLDVQYNTRYKKLKKAREEGNEIFNTLNKLGDIMTSPEEVEEWRFKEYVRQDDDLYNDPFEWMRVDTDYEWIAKFHLKQPDHMYGAQLQYDRDVEAQYDAVKFLGDVRKPDMLHTTLLTRTLLDKRYYYGVRIAAAEALASFSRPDNNFLGVDFLIRIYQRLYCFPDSLIPVSNDFNDFGEFFLQKTIPRILSKVRDADGNVPTNIKKLLLSVVKYNDNSNNDFQDSYYISELLEALTDSAICRGPVLDDLSSDPFVKTVVSEISRIQKLDEWVPSYHNVVAVTCMRQKIKLALNGLFKFSFEDLLYYTVERYPSEIRVEAFRGLLVLGGLKNADVLRYWLKTTLLSTLVTPALRRQLIKVLLDSICVAAVSGTPPTLDDDEFKTWEKLLDGDIPNNPTNMVIVEDGANSEMDKKRDSFARENIKGAIEVLRRDFAIGKGLQEVLWELLHSSLLSLNERRDVFSICQILYKEEDVFLVRVPVPSVPVKEFRKKIVAKNLGEGKVVIRREGRFKIQLSTVKHEDKKPSRASERQRGKPAEEPKLAAQPAIVDVEQETPLVLFDALAPHKVTFKFKRLKLQDTRPLVQVSGSVVTFVLQNRRNRDHVRRWMRRPVVKLTTKNRVEVLAESLQGSVPETLPSVVEAEPPVQAAQPVKMEEVVPAPMVKEEEPRLREEAPVNGHEAKEKTPTPFSRSGSPFASPSTVQKKKKKIYIHGSRTPSPEKQETEANNDTNTNTGGAQNEAITTTDETTGQREPAAQVMEAERKAEPAERRAEPAERKAEVEAREATIPKKEEAHTAEETSAPAPTSEVPTAAAAPKPKLKLKLTLKK